MINYTKDEVLKMYSEEELNGFYKRLAPPNVKITKSWLNRAVQKNSALKLINMAEEFKFLLRVSEGGVKPRKELFTHKWLGKADFDASRKLGKFKEKIKAIKTSNGDSLFNILISEYDLRYHIASLNGPHNGNCICIPTNCDRCEAERFFDIVYTADWQQNEGKLMLEMLIDAEMWDGGSCIEDNLEDPEYMNLNNLEN